MHPAQDERVLLDVTVDLHLVAVRANAAGRDGLRARDGAVHLACDLAHAGLQLGRDAVEQRVGVGLQEWEGRDLDALRAVGRRHLPRRTHDLPAGRRLKAKARAADELRLGRARPPAA